MLSILSTQSFYHPLKSRLLLFSRLQDAGGNGGSNERPDIARALGGARSGTGGWWNCRCPICGGDGKLGLKSGGGKLAVNCFKGCTRAEVISELHCRGMLQPGAAPAVDPEDERRRIEADAASRRAAIANAMDIWQHETFA